MESITVDISGVQDDSPAAAVDRAHQPHAVDRAALPALFAVTPRETGTDGHEQRLRPRQPFALEEGELGLARLPCPPSASLAGEPASRVPFAPVDRALASANRRAGRAG